MSPRIAQFVEQMRKDAAPADPSLAQQQVSKTISLIVDQQTYRQLGLMAAMLQTDLEDLDKGEMDILIQQIRDAQDFVGI